MCSSDLLRRTFDLSSCTVVRGTIEATGSSGSINLGIDTQGGPGAQVVVKGGGYLANAQITEVEKFLHEPAAWSSAHGGAASFPSS